MGSVDACTSGGLTKENMKKAITDHLFQLHRRVSALNEQRIKIQTGLILFAYFITLANALLGIGALAVLIYGYRSTLALHSSEYLKQYQVHIALLLPALVFIGIAFQIQPMASDDLLRDLIIGRHYNYDYSKLYPISQLPKFSMWWGFDHFLAWIQNYMSANVAMWLLQAVLYIGISLIVAKVSMSILSERADKVYWAGMAVAITIYLSVGRIALARPEIILAVWLLSAALLRSNRNIIVWLIGGGALCSTYWLAFLYFPAVILIKTSLKNKTKLLAALVSIHLAFWLGMFGADYIQALAWLPQVLANQITIVGENAGFEILIGNPLILSLIALIAIGLFRNLTRQSWGYAAILCYFIFSNQVRYIGTIAPLMALLVLQLWKHKLPKLNAAGMTIAACLCFFLQIESVQSVPSLKNAPNFTLPPTARVMTAYDLATYAVPYSNPGIQIEPSYAFGAAPKALQQLALDIGGKGEQPSCTVLIENRFTHVIEQTMNDNIPTCLELVAVNKKWRLWHVRQ